MSISVPSTPKTLTVVENPLLPALLLVWDLDPSSLVDEVYIKVCSLKKCPEKTFTANKMQNDMLNHFNISQDILDKNVTYSFSITASSYGTMGSESLKAYLTKSESSSSFILYSSSSCLNPDPICLSWERIIHARSDKI